MVLQEWCRLKNTFWHYLLWNFCLLLEIGATRKLKLNCQPGGYNRRSFIPGQVDHFFQAGHDVEDVTGLQFYFKELPSDFNWKIRKLIIKKTCGNCVPEVFEWSNEEIHPNDVCLIGKGFGKVGKSSIKSSIKRTTPTIKRSSTGKSSIPQTPVSTDTSDTETISLVTTRSARSIIKKPTPYDPFPGLYRIQSVRNHYVMFICDSKKRHHSVRLAI